MRVRMAPWFLVLALVAMSTATRAELFHYQGRTLLAAITDGSDPFGRGFWDPLRDIPAVQFLNPDGSDRGDGPPDVQWDADGIPHVVWAYRNGGQHDIAYSHWDGSRWAPTRFLDLGDADAVDPRIHVASDGRLFVAWWTPADRRIHTTRRAAGQAVWDPPRVFALGGKRPSLATYEGVLRVVFEASLGGWDTNAIAVVRQGSIPEIYLPADRDERLDPVIHSLCGKLWIDYKRSDDELGVLLLESSPVGGPSEGTDGFGDDGWFEQPWSELTPEPWVDPSWIGVEFARRAVQLRLLAPGGPTVPPPLPLRPPGASP